MLVFCPHLSSLLKDGTESDLQSYKQTKKRVKPIQREKNSPDIKPGPRSGPRSGLRIVRTVEDRKCFWGLW